MSDFSEPWRVRVGARYTPSRYSKLEGAVVFRSGSPQPDDHGPALRTEPGVPAAVAERAAECVNILAGVDPGAVPPDALTLVLGYLRAPLDPGAGSALSDWLRERFGDGEGAVCGWDGCDRPGTVLACGRELADGDGHPTPARYCDAHAKTVVDEMNPEYHDDCPNCGCRFGVN